MSETVVKSKICSEMRYSVSFSTFTVNKTSNYSRGASEVHGLFYFRIFYLLPKSLVCRSLLSCFSLPRFF